MAKSDTLIVVEVSIPNGSIVVRPDPVVVSARDTSIEWRIVTPGWKFPTWSDGIKLQAHHNDFSNAASNPAGDVFTMRNRNSIRKSHKYSVFVEKGGTKLSLDPTIDNQG